MHIREEGEEMKEQHSGRLQSNIQVMMVVSYFTIFIELSGILCQLSLVCRVILRIKFGVRPSELLRNGILVTTKKFGLFMYLRQGHFGKFGIIELCNGILVTTKKFGLFMYLRQGHFGKFGILVCLCI